MTKLFTVVLILVLLSSCFKSRTYLTSKEKSWNPYKEGQVLIFESSNYERDTIHIEKVDFGFPDGLGVEYYEFLKVFSKRSSSPDLGEYFSKTFGFLTIAAKSEKEPSYIEFGIEVQNAQFIERQHYSFEDLSELAETWLTIPYGKFDDVIVIGNKTNYSSIPKAIETIYWSKSKGYIRLDKYDGTYWELIEIIEP